MAEASSPAPPQSRARTAPTSPKHGVVVVSMNYRLGIFGFFAHPELADENDHNATGNYGLMDQVAALALGQAQHRRIRRRSRQRHHLR